MPKKTSIDFVTRMAKVYETARKRQADLQAYNKARRDTNRHHAVFENNDPVIVWEPPKALNKEEKSIYDGKIPKKLQHRWSIQTWYINAPSPVTTRDEKPATLYTIKNSEGEVRGTPVNVNRLRHFYPWADEMPTTNDYEPPEGYIEDGMQEPFTKSPGVNVKIGTFVLIPTGADHVLPYIIGEVITMGPRQKNKHRDINIHLYGNNNKSIDDTQRPAWTRKNEQSWIYKEFAIKGKSRYPPTEGGDRCIPKTSDKLKLKLNSRQICALFKPRQKHNITLPVPLIRDVKRSEYFTYL